MSALYLHKMAAGTVDFSELLKELTPDTLQAAWGKDPIYFVLIKGHNTNLADRTLVIEKWSFIGYRVPEGELYPAKVELAKITVKESSL